MKILSISHQNYTPILKIGHVCNGSYRLPIAHKNITGLDGQKLFDIAHVSYLNDYYVRILNVAHSVNMHKMDYKLLDIASASLPEYISGDGVNSHGGNRRFWRGKDKHFTFNLNSDYFVLIYIEGELVSCDVCESISITRREREAALATLVLQEQKGTLDFMKYHGKRIEIGIQHAKGVTPLFVGKIDEPTFRIFDRRAVLKCSDMRTQRIENMSKAEISKIGFYSDIAFNHDEPSNAVELERRLDTIPASYEFDKTGKGRLTEWKPKENADFEIGDCGIYKREPTFSVLPVGRVVNSVLIKFRNNYKRLHQYDLKQSYRGSQDPCKYNKYHHVLNPRRTSVETALSGTGWRYRILSSAGLPRQGKYLCSIGGDAYVFWKPAQGSVETNGKTTKINSEVYQDDFITSATWILSKRWVQNIQQSIELTIKSDASIKLYGLNQRTDTYNSETDYDDKEFTEGAAYKQPEKGGTPSYNKVRGFVNDGMFRWGWSNADDSTGADGQIWSSGANGGQGVNNNWNGQDYDFSTKDQTRDSKDYQEVFTYAINKAKTSIYASHRENILTLEMPFFPDVDLHHTLAVNAKFFTGNVKASAVTHTFDIASKTAETTIEGKFYKGFKGVNQTPVYNPRFEKFKGYKGFKDNEYYQYSMHIVPRLIEQNQRLLKQYMDEGGFLMRQKNDLPVGSVGSQLEEYKFVVHTPEIPKEYTDAYKYKNESTANIDIPDDAVELRL